MATSLVAQPMSVGRERLLVAGLLVLSVIPVAAGAFRLQQLILGVPVTESNERFFDAPIPVGVHIVSVTLFAVLGAFQFAPTLRRRYNRWHRTAGAILIPAGFLTAISGLWMTATYDLPELDGVAVNTMRYVVGTVMVGELLLAVRALGNRDYVVHGEWMTRAWAIAMAAGTQAFTSLPLLVTGTSLWSRAVAMGLGWAINIVVAERVIRRRRAAALR